MRRFTIAILIGWFALPAASSAQEPKERTIPFEGAEVFCHILFHEGLQPIEALNALRDDPKDSLLIVFGNPERIHEVHEATGGLREFLKQGGNLLIVTDYRLNVLDVRIGGPKVTQPAKSAYRGEPQCPWLASAAGGAHPLFRSLRKGIATNSPSYAFLHPRDSALQPLLEFPNDALTEPFAPGVAGRPGPAYMIGSANARPHGRVLIIAGQGMFMNGMMLQTDKNKNLDNDNFDFAVNAIRWLRERPDGTTRTRALLMVDGKVVTRFDMNLSPRAELPTPQIPIPPVKALNRLIRGMEDERLFHKMLRGLLGESFDRVIGVLFALATFGLLLYGAKKFLEGRYHHETGVPRMVGAAPPLGPGLRRGQQRQLAFYQQADLAKESGQLVSAWLLAEFGVQPGAAVALQASGFLWARWRLQRQADWVLAVAGTPEPMRVTRHDFAALFDALPELSRAVAAGRLALLVDGKNVRQIGG